MKTPHKCPVCLGSGIAPAGLYPEEAMSIFPKCKSCENGIIWGEDEKTYTKQETINLFNEYCDYMNDHEQHEGDRMRFEEFIEKYEQRNSYNNEHDDLIETLNNGIANAKTDVCPSCKCIAGTTCFHSWHRGLIIFNAKVPSKRK
mgnify:CR=1 FL=1